MSAMDPVVIRMPADLHAAIKAKAATEERSFAQVVRRAMRMYLEEAPDAH